LRSAGWALLSCVLPLHAADQEWPAYLGDKASTHYSPLRQITPRNVARLTVAWTYRAGDARKDNRSQIQCNPLIIGGVLYGTTPELKVVALDAAKGIERWRFDPFANTRGGAVGVNRGLVYWAADGEARLFAGAGAYLYAIEARTGQPVTTFGTNGRVDLREGLGRDVTGLALISTTPGVICQDRLIMGMRVGEGPGPTAPGHIQAYDVRTGRIV